MIGYEAEDFSAESGVEPSDSIDIIDEGGFVEFAEVIAAHESVVLQLDRNWKEIDDISCSFYEQMTEPEEWSGGSMDHVRRLWSVGSKSSRQTTRKIEQLASAPIITRVRYSRAIARHNAVLIDGLQDGAQVESRFFDRYLEEDPPQWREETLELKLAAEPLEEKRVAITQSYMRDRFHYDFERSLLDLFYDTEADTSMMVNVVADYVGADVASARSFLDWIEQVIEVEDGRYRALLPLLAADINDAQWEQQIPAAFESLDENMEEALLAEYLHDALFEEDSAASSVVRSWIAIFGVEVGDDLAEGSPIATMLAQRRNMWPKEFEDTFQSYVLAQRELFKSRLRALSGSLDDTSRYKPTDKRLSTLYRAYRDAVDRGIHKALRGRSEIALNQRTIKRKSNGSKRKGKGGSKKQKPGVELGLEFTGERPQSYELAMLDVGSERTGLVDELSVEDSFETIVSMYEGTHGLDSSKMDVYWAVSAVRDDPKRPGTIKILDADIPSVNGSGSVDLRCFDVAYLEDNQEDTLSDFCIVYALVDGDKVALHEILDRQQFAEKYPGVLVDSGVEATQ